MTSWARRDFARTPTRGERVVDAVVELRRRARRLLDWLVQAVGDAPLVDENKLLADQLATLIGELEARAREFELKRRRAEVARLSAELVEVGGEATRINIESADKPTLGGEIQRMTAEIERRRMGVRR